MHFLALVGCVTGAVAVSACTGVVSGGVTNGGTGGDPGGGGMTPSPTLADCSGIPNGVPAAVPLQRLNRAQYAQVVNELFGTAAATAAGFPPSLAGYPFATYSSANPMGESQVQAALDAAEAVAMQVADQVPACSGNETNCASTYLKNLATKAFRRAATSDELSLIMGAYTRARSTISYPESVAIGVSAILQMPQFLYQVEDQPTAVGGTVTTLTDAQLAARMALLYWNGLPDQTLLEAASSGALSTPANRLEQAQRMVQDPRARVVLSDFIRQWMTIKDFHAETHTAEVQAALDEQLRRDIEAALASDSGLHDLLASSKTSVNSVLEKFYGLPAQSKGPNDWREVDLGPDARVGILTHPMMMAKFAHGMTPSPILRGKFVRMMVMCDDLQSPPAGAQEMQNMISAPGASIRVQSEARLGSPTCGGCHQMMDPIGFGFSAFTGIGTYAPTADGAAVDVAGHITSAATELNGDFNGVRELGEKLVASPKVKACMAQQWLRYAFGVQESAMDACTVQALAAQFGTNQSLVSMFAGLSGLDAFAQRRAVGAK